MLPFKLNLAFFIFTFLWRDVFTADDTADTIFLGRIIFNIAVAIAAVTKSITNITNSVLNSFIFTRREPINQPLYL